METGLVTAGRSPAGDAYELNRNHFFAKQIAELFQAKASIRQELASFLWDGLLARTDKVERATLFGSVVEGSPLNQRYRSRRPFSTR